MSVAKSVEKKSTSAKTKKTRVSKKNKLKVKTDEELFAEFRAAAASCMTCLGTRRVKKIADGYASVRRAGTRCPVCKPEQERIFNFWLDHTPSDGKRSWRSRIHSFVVKNYKDYHRVVGVTVGAEDIEQDVVIAVWQVWDRYYNPNYLSEKTGQPVKLCTYVWRAIQTAWAKVTERAFNVRNTVYMTRKEDACSDDHSPIYNPDVMRSTLAGLTGSINPKEEEDKLVKKLQTTYDKRPFTPAILQELVTEAERFREENEGETVLSSLRAVLPQVAKKKRNAVPVHMVTKSLDAPATEDEENSKNSDFIEDMDYRHVGSGSVDPAQRELIERAKRIVARHLHPVDQHILLHCVVSDAESARSVASQYRMTVADVKSHMTAVKKWFEDARQRGIFDELIK